MSSINNIGGQPLGPSGLFSRVDSDHSGGVSQSELQKLSDAIADKTGKTIDTGDEGFKGYDSDGNGSLNGEELRTVLDKSGFGPQRDLQGMAPPPPPRQAAVSYADNQSDSEKNILASLVTRMQDLLDTLKSGQDAGIQPPPGGSPTDIFGKVDTDRSGSLSKNELKVLAENIKKTTGQTLDVSAEAIAALDRNGDGELSPDEIDLRKTLTMQSADMSGDPSVKDLRTALDTTWQQSQNNTAKQDEQLNAPVSGNHDSLLKQMTEVKKLLDVLTKYYGSDKNGSERGISVTS